MAAAYAAWRPGYPADVVAFLAGGEAGHDRPRRILDLGAGTGLLTESLVAAGHEVVAVTRSAERAEALRAAGIVPLVADVADRASLSRLPPAGVAL